MHVIHARNVNDALPSGLRYLATRGFEEPSRNGPVLVAPGPVATVYLRPKEHVLFNAVRNANPFFHMFEALWMLGGRNDVAFPHRYAPMMLYSDDSETLNGAYGYRWRHHFGQDQLELIIEELKTNPASRRCVLSMWDPQDTLAQGGYSGYEGDLKRAIAGGKDVPCNTHAYFRIQEGRLDMTVCNRSNDVVWGAYGANAVHFAIMQEYAAGGVGVEQGTYTQFANNFHLYKEREDVVRITSDGCPADGRYWADNTELRPRLVPLMGKGRSVFDAELRTWLANPDDFEFPYVTSFIQLAQRMAHAHFDYKAGHLGAALDTLNSETSDWGQAGYEWLRRIAAKRATKRGSAA